mgnify:FL=1
MKQLFAIVALTSAFLVPANTVWAACTDEHAAKDLIQTTTQKVLDALATNAVDTESILKKEVVPNFDWERMSSTVLGRNSLGKSKWKRRATGNQQALQDRFVEAFKSLLVRTYKTSLKEATGPNFKVKYLPVCGKNLDKRKRVKVKARVIQGAKQIAVDFKMSKSKRTGNQWKAYDVYVEGISLLSNYKNEFKPLTIEEAITKIKQAQ